MNIMHASLFSATILPESMATVYTETAIRRKTIGRIFDNVRSITNIVASDNGCYLILHLIHDTVSLLSVIFEESNNLKASPQSRITVRRRIE